MTRRWLAIVLTAGLVVGWWSIRDAADEVTTLAPGDLNPVLREAQTELWQELRGFASAVELTAAQWHLFERDLLELARRESVAQATAVETGDYKAVLELGRRLGRDLEARCSAYMMKEQVAELRFRFHTAGLVTRVRQLHYVPRFAPRT